MKIRVRRRLDWAEDPPAHKYVRPALPSAPPKPPADGEQPPPEAPPAPPAVDTARCAGTDEGADKDLERSSTPPPPERDGGDEATEKPTAPAAATELAGRPPQKSVGTYLNNLYDSLVFAIIRPPRSVYDERRLGPTSFAVDGAGRFHRRDVRLRNVRGEELRCSHWVPEAYGDDGVKRPCVIFMHANSAARVQALHYVSLVLSLGCTFFSFDCAGSGLSDGTYVSLGWRESRDLHVVARYLRRLGTVSSLGAWGCSMGAASIIFYLAASGDTTHMEKLTRGRGAGASSLLKKRKDSAAAPDAREAPRRTLSDQLAAAVVGEAPPPESPKPPTPNKAPAPRGGDAAARVDVEPLDAVVLDSPYSDIHQLAVDLASTRLIGGFSTPWVVTQAVLHFLETTILETAKFNISDLKPIDHVGDCATPALFLHAEDDSLVGISHMEALVRSYGGPRVLAMVEGTHSSPRSKRTLDFVGKFLCKHMRITPDADFARNFALERVAPGPRFLESPRADAAPRRSVPWVRQDHRLVKVNGLAYSRGARVSSAPPAPEAPRAGSRATTTPTRPRPTDRGSRLFKRRAALGRRGRDLVRRGARRRGPGARRAAVEAEERSVDLRVVDGQQAAARHLRAEHRAAVVLLPEHAEVEAVPAEAERRHDVAEAEQEPRLGDEREQFAGDEQVDARGVVAVRVPAAPVRDARPHALQRDGRDGVERDEADEGREVGPAQRVVRLDLPRAPVRMVHRFPTRYLSNVATAAGRWS